MNYYPDTYAQSSACTNAPAVQDHIERRAKELAGNGFSHLDPETVTWIQDAFVTDNWCSDASTVHQALFAAITGGSRAAGVARIRELFVEARFRLYENKACQELHDLGNEKSRLS